MQVKRVPPARQQDTFDATGLTFDEVMTMRQALLAASGVDCHISRKEEARRLHDTFALAS